MMRDAFAHYTDYNASVIQSRGFHFGRGVNTNPIEAITIYEQNRVMIGYQRSVLLDYQRDGSIVGYKVHRGSDYDCPVCDELCVGIHLIDEQVLPAHPHCCCWTTPVRASDLLLGSASDIM